MSDLTHESEPSTLDQQMYAGMESTMELATILQDLDKLGRQLEHFEKTYEMPSAVFYEQYCAGQEPEDDAWVLDFAAWAGLYEVWRDRQQAYREIVGTQPLT
jgi:hypothetical protein